MARSKTLITPKPLPKATRRGRTNEYMMALDQFLAADCESALVNISKKPATVAPGLTKAIKSDRKYAKVKVARRGAEVYLVKA
jgi:hypothetical protein